MCEINFDLVLTNTLSKDIVQKDVMNLTVIAPNRRIRCKRWDSGFDIVMKARKRGWWMKWRVWPIAWIITS